MTEASPLPEQPAATTAADAVPGAASRPVFLLVGDAHFHQVQGRILRSRGIDVVEVIGVEGVIDALQTSSPCGAIVELKRGTAATFAVLEGLRRLRPALPLVVASHQPSVGPPELRRGPNGAGVRADGATPRAAAGAPVIPGASFREIERHAILSTYEACGRSPSRTAEILGLSLRTVHYRLREYRGEMGRRTRGVNPPFGRPSAPANGHEKGDTQGLEGAH